MVRNCKQRQQSPQIWRVNHISFATRPGYEGEQHDRPHSSVPKLQEALALAVLEAAEAAAVPTVVVLVHGGSMAIEAIKDRAPAILDAHYPGIATGGQAVADALYGKFSPAGKLPYSVMPAAFDKLSFFPSMSMTDPPGRTYRYYPTSPDLPPILIPFGFGLTYTSWQLTVHRLPSPASAASASSSSSPSSVSPLPSSSAAASASKFKFQVRCLNTGSYNSDEVVQVYLEAGPAEAAMKPHRQLIDFQRVHARAGQAAVVVFAVSADQLALVSADGTRHVTPGTYTLAFTNGVDQTARAEVSVN